MLLKLYDKNNNPQDLQRIIDILNDGGLIIYPTDTMLTDPLKFNKDFFVLAAGRQTEMFTIPDQRDRP